MPDVVVPSFLACLSLVPAALFALAGRGDERPFPALCGLALTGPLIWLAMRSETAWQTDFATALWITVAATMICFSGLCIVTREATRLGGVVLPYMSFLAFTAFVWEVAGPSAFTTITSNWVVFHILVSVLAYAVVTLAACAACAGLLQERALKNKNPTKFTHHLPSVSYCNELQFKLLALGELILGIGLLSGIASSVAKGGPVLQFDHKTMFALAAFVVVGALLVIQQKSDVRGRHVMRVILGAYLLLTLAYPGVKFVTDILLSA